MFTNSSVRFRVLAPEEPRTITILKEVFKDPWWWLEPLAIFVLIALTCFYYVYDVFYVVPRLLGSLGQMVNFVLCTWIVYNIFGNFWACCRQSSSVDTLRPELMQPVQGEEHLWHYCDQCQKLMPPRVWHCIICKCCILKRDHHCSFTANCIGHNNQRYYIWLLFYMSLGSGLVLIYNFSFTLMFALNKRDWLLSYSPLANVIFGLTEQGMWYRYLVRAIFYVNLLCLVIPLILLVMQILLVQSNAVSADPSDRTYDLGTGRNFAQVLGNRGFWTLLSPTMKSPLPHEGIQWQSKHTV